MDINSRTDILSWSISYEKEMDRHVKETELIENMDGWSIAGKDMFSKKNSKILKY